MQDIDAIQEITLLGIFPTTLCYYYLLYICPSLFSPLSTYPNVCHCVYLQSHLTYFCPLLPAMIIFELHKTMFQKSGQKFNSKKKRKGVNVNDHTIMYMVVTLSFGVFGLFNAWLTSICQALFFLRAIYFNVMLKKLIRMIQKAIYSYRVVLY